ncbi:MAG: LCP family protein [Mycobacteriaceae bacterium]|nr:LCP family protein [Mycobacteriaceae bacterium]
MIDDETVPISRIPGTGRAGSSGKHARGKRAGKSGDSSKPVRTSRSARSGRVGGNARRIGLIASRLVVGTLARAIVAGTAFAWTAETSFDEGFTRSAAIEADAPKSMGGDLNILLIGLDTRKDLDGNDLPKDILKQLHAGDGTQGGYNANTLILMHIPADLKKITAFSIPRDDYVPVKGIPGYDHAKIKEAYGLKKYAFEQKLEAQGEKDPVRLEHKGREAGRQSIVQTVRDLTGVPIDLFAEISLAGFYDVAKQLGGVDVCLNHAVKDKFYSGANFPAGRQHLNASQALSFVRQRHGLDNGDLDRTHRQQAFLTSVAKQLKDAGTLTNPVRLKGLMDVAHKDVVLSSNWNLIEFAQDLGKADRLGIEFRTLPIKGYQNVNGQDVNVVDAKAIRKEVRTAFGLDKAQPKLAAPTTPPTSTLNVFNNGAASGLARQVSESLATRGYQQGDVGNATASDGETSLTYGSGAGEDAKYLASLFGGDIEAKSSSSVKSGQIKLVLGTEFEMPDALSSSPAATTTPGSGATPAQAPSPKSDGSPDNGSPVTTSFGGNIPCVN